MVRYLIKKEGVLTDLSEPQPGCWINISPPYSQVELDEFANEYEIPTDFLTDSLDIDERSRYEREEGVRLIVVNAPIINESHSDNDAIYITAPIGIILLDDHIITITAFENPVLELFLENRIKGFQPGDFSLFVLQIFEQIVYRFLNCLKKLNVKRNLIEKELYNASRNKELLQMLSIEKSLVYIVNSLSANELLKMKMKRVDFLRINDNEELTDLFEDIIIDNSQALEVANIHTNILQGTMEAYASIISNNLNIVIQRLTLITIILMVPTLVASFYGMNVEGLPFNKSAYAFYYIIIASLVGSLLLAWFFRTRRLF